MRQVFPSKSGAIPVEAAPAPACGSGDVAIDVAFPVISTGTETASVAATDLRSRVTQMHKRARLGVELLATARGWHCEGLRAKLAPGGRASSHPRGIRETSR